MSFYRLAQVSVTPLPQEEHSVASAETFSDYLIKYESRQPVHFNGNLIVLDFANDASDDVWLPFVAQLDEFTNSKGLDPKRSFRQRPRGSVLEEQPSFVIKFARIIHLKIFQIPGNLPHTVTASLLLEKIRIKV